MARFVLIAGAVVSMALMLRAGARQQSVVLILLFTVWVLSPFIALDQLDRRAGGWPPRLRTALHAAMIGVTVVAVDIYGLHAIRGGMKAGFVYLFGPAMSWLLIALVLGANAIAWRRR